jgi:formate dehydrogenase accessory protein FdhE
MAIGDKDNRVLKAMAAAREQHPELIELLDFYYDLYEVQFEAKSQLPEPERRDEQAMRWRLERGMSQLAYGQLGVETDLFKPLVAQVAEVLVRYNPSWESEQKELTADELLSLAREVYETWDTLTAPKAGLKDRDESKESTGHATALAVSLSLAPYLQQASEAILPQLDLTLWRKGNCPVCGGRPNFSVLDEDTGARKLMCSRCDSLWRSSRFNCPFCAIGEKTAFYSSEDDLYRLYVCPECKHYLKAVDLRKARRVILPMVERLLTVGMDLTAREEGYHG